jgi:tRNA pseudouridine55 synthase
LIPVSGKQTLGLLLADKPAGLTSHDVVARARRVLGVRRVGHAGTLDPFATGLLILLVGRATRLARYFTPLVKTYDVVARLGARSSTGDPEGEIVETGNVPADLILPLGLVRQRPPAYSAVKVDGERAYARARRGEDVVTAEREVTVHESAELWREGPLVGLRFVCSSGTYVRALVEALGDAYCVELRRATIGPFGAAGAWPGEGPASVLPVAEAWSRFGTVLELAQDEAVAVGHGRAIAGRGVEEPVLLVDGAGDALAVAVERDGMLRVDVGLRGTGAAR